ncbi:MAG: hypothetical protein H8E37_11705, partial [Planctomycetes bacterium]|nr:hypothetical protein [Planctomycetota bacterium]
MADPATLLEWAQSRYDALNAGLTEMRTRLKSARVALLGDPDDETKPGALANYSTLVTEVASLDDDIAATRREIAAASSPADIEALAEELEDLLIDLSLQKGKLIAASAQLNSAQTEADLAQEAVRQIEREVAEAAATLTEETARKEFHDELKSAIGQEPLSLIQEAAAFVKPDPEDEEEVNEAEDEEAEGDEEEPAEENEEEAEEGGEEVADEEAENAEEAEEEVADDEVPDEAADEEELNPTDFELLVAETQQAYSDAQDQITEDIPEPLRTRAGARRQQVSRDLERKAELTDLAEELLATQRDSHEGSGTVAALVGKQFAFEAAQTAFREFAQHGLEWFESAAALLTRVIGSAEISEADKTAIGDLTAAGAAAAALEQARDEAQADVEDARLAINRKILQVL